MIANAEQLRLPEQLYIMLFDLADGKTDYLLRRMVHAFATAIVYELLDAGALLTQEKMVKKVQQIDFQEEYLHEAALIAADCAPIDGNDLIWELVNELHPIWDTVAEGMVAKKLLTQSVQSRFILLHHVVFRGLPDTFKYRDELQRSINKTLSNLRNPDYDIQLLYNQQRLLALLMILDNHKLLRLMIGDETHRMVKTKISNIRMHFLGIEGNSNSFIPRYSWDRKYTSSAERETYDSGSDIWISLPDYNGHGGQGSDDGQFDRLQVEIDGLGSRC
jgi:hypothetical protein